jgi:hypothetical protein
MPVEALLTPFTAASQAPHYRRWLIALSEPLDTDKRMGEDRSMSSRERDWERGRTVAAEFEEARCKRDSR